MNASFVRLTFLPGTVSNGLSVQDTGFHPLDECNHVDALNVCNGNELRIESVINRVDHSMNNVQDENDWEALQVPRNDGNNVEMWMVFL